MLSALSNERNVTLIAPRRIGKTGLIKNVFYLMRQQEVGVSCFYMDIFATRDLPSFVRLFAETVLGQLDTLSETVLHKLTSFFSFLSSGNQRGSVDGSTHRFIRFCAG